MGEAESWCTQGVEGAESSAAETWSGGSGQQEGKVVVAADCLLIFPLEPNDGLFV